MSSEAINSPSVSPSVSASLLLLLLLQPMAWSLQASSLELQSMRFQDAWTSQSQCVHARPEHDGKKGSMAWSLECKTTCQWSHVLCGQLLIPMNKVSTEKMRRCQLWQISRRRLTSRRPMSSCATWSGDVFLSLSVSGP